MRVQNYRALITDDRKMALAKPDIYMYPLPADRNIMSRWCDRQPQSVVYDEAETDYMPKKRSWL
jgi:hypothetical protein